MQVKLTALSHTATGFTQYDFWVNPRYVTSVLPAREHTSKIWIVGHSGYGTYEMQVLGVPAEIATRLNEAEDERKATA